MYYKLRGIEVAAIKSSAYQVTEPFIMYERVCRRRGPAFGEHVFLVATVKSLPTVIMIHDGALLCFRFIAGFVRNFVFRDDRSINRFFYAIIFRKAMFVFSN